MNNTVSSRAEAQELDAADPLRPLKDEFDLPSGVLYLDGNSLGPPPRRVATRLQETIGREWAQDLIQSWNTAGWIDLPERCGSKIAKLIGAPADEVIVADSVSINIFKLAAAVFSKHGGDIAVFAHEFPTDGYILQGLSALSGATLRTLAPGDDPFEGSIRTLVLSVVDYKTADVADVRALEKRASEAGVSIIWDLSHAVGLLPLDLAGDGARYAVGCGYKYLNGGPGAPAFVYVRNGLDLFQPLSGWMGHKDPFAFDKTYHPAEGIRRFACATPPILSMSALDTALDLFDGIDLKHVALKARELGDLFLSRALERGLETISPAPGEQRGGHVSLRLDHGYEVVQALIARGVIGDFRAPNLARFGFSPLFLSYTDVWDAADALINVLDTDEWRDPKYALRGKVT